MRRLSCRCVAVFSILVSFLAFAQEEPPLTANTESAALIEQYQKELGELKTPESKAAALSRLLSFQLRFTDKAPAAETVKALLTLAESLEKGTLRTQLLEAVVFAQSELDDYDGAAKTVDLIDKPQDRAESQLNLAEKFLAETEKKKSEKPFDVVALLRKAVGGAAEAKDPGLGALALAVLGGELLKTNNVDDAKAAFQQSREKARELEEIEERNITALIIRNKIRGGLNTEAVALVDTVNTDEAKAALTGMIAVTEANAGRLDAARKTIDSMNPGNARDNALVELGRQTAKTEDAAMLLELSKAMSSPERSEMFQQEILARLAEEKRFDIAEEFAEGAAKPEECRLALSVRRLELLIAEKKFDDAAKLIETFTNPQLRAGATHHLASACVQAGEIDTAGRLLESSRSEDETAVLKELSAAATKAAAETNLDIRTESQFEILRAQLQLLDLKGARQTLAAMIDTVQKVENPVRRVQYSMVLAQVLSQLDKPQAKTTLGELFTFLVGIEDPMTLKELVPKQDSDPADPTQPTLVLDLPVDESAVKEQLFILYANIGNTLSQVGDAETAKKALGKATEMLAAEPDTAIKLEKMLLITQVYAEIK